MDFETFFETIFSFGAIFEAIFLGAGVDDVKGTPSLDAENVDSLAEVVANFLDLVLVTATDSSGPTVLLFLASAACLNRLSTIRGINLKNLD